MGYLIKPIYMSEEAKNKVRQQALKATAEYLEDKMKHKVGDKITYDTPLSGGGIYEAEILELESENVYKVKVLKVIHPSRNPIAPQKAGDIDHIIRE